MSEESEFAIIGAGQESYAFRAAAYLKMRDGDYWELTEDLLRRVIAEELRAVLGVSDV